MNYTKKILSLLLALVMVFAMAVTVGAQEIDLGGNSIIVNNAKADQTYKLYKMLDLVVDSSNTAYSYTVNSAWSTFFSEGGNGAKYVTITNGYVTWKEDQKNNMDAFAKEAEAFAKDKDAIKTIKTGIDASVVFSNLKAGYYLVTSTLGSKAIVATTPSNPNTVINEKNEVPTIEKKVQEDSTEVWGDQNDADIGQTVNFKTTVHAKKGAENYVVHDQMENGLTLNQNSITVKVGENALTKDTDYTVNFNNDDGCDFEICFKNTYLDTIVTSTDIVITYSAVLNENAEISTDSNDNKTKLDYGDNSSTEWDETKTCTFKFDIVKTDSNKKLLSGAKFELYDAQTSGNKIALVKETDGTYRVATASEKETDGFTSAVIEAGKVTVKGLDGNTTYWLEETVAPDGYNKLSSRVEVKIETSNLTTTMAGDTWTDGNGGVHITNNTGTELPSTGGMGTTIFYILGSVLVLAAVVLLVTKKRMGSENA